MYQKKDDAVSPVIGVILMVAITVILAAVIAAFVFGLAGNVSSTKNVAITAQQQATDKVQITNNGGTDVNKVTTFKVQVHGADATVVGSTSFTDDETRVGAYSVYTLSGDKRVVVTGTFSDGSTAVLLDKTF